MENTKKYTKDCDDAEAAERLLQSTDNVERLREIIIKSQTYWEIAEESFKYGVRQRMEIE